jgi:hypothetical protein
MFVGFKLLDNYISLMSLRSLTKRAKSRTQTKTKVISRKKSKKQKLNGDKKKLSRTKMSHRALVDSDWIELARQKGFIFRWDDVKNMQVGEKVVLVGALTQGFYVTSTKPDVVYSPTTFFKKQKYLYEHKGCSGKVCRGVLNGVDYSSFDGPFYEFQGDAVTGSGADLYMKWIHLKKMPKIFWSEDK